MKILFIVPGSGDFFYCGNCFRDNLQASALRKAGHEVIVMPLYLPLRHRSFQADTPLFFPATTFYTAQKFFGKRKMPDWLKRITGSDTLLNVASSLSGSTSAEGLEEMTLAMITGKDAAFLDMVDQLICWVKDREKPDIIHLSSTLLIGIAKEIKRYLDTPIVCSVQDEEVWIDNLDERCIPEAWRGIEENSRYIDRFVTTSHFYKEISVLSVPLRFEEGVGLYLCEAFAAGRPAVEPATGSFPEIVDKAGILYEWNDSDCLATALETLLTDKVLLRQCRENALLLSSSRYNDWVLGERLSNMYQCLI